ncbi:VOC family protein [Protaetiibacter larvae]|uniref:VOC family protein n=1 Tax=Protaetiibacter larvae TaxID=2592654 RepID=A0A5C1Y849_9MICO|nr:VOC family protein [Protaetiibacter larvae]QEO10154.1 VOC family protein [Protaetiibacter larvae]
MFSLGRVTILVEDLDRSLAFYRDLLGFAVLYDGEFVPGVRTAHLGTAGVRDPGIWLLPAGEHDRERVGAQTGGAPALVLYTPELQGALRRLEAAGVTVVKPLVRDGDAAFAHVLDDSGNELLLAELGAVDERAYRLID